MHLNLSSDEEIYQAAAAVLAAGASAGAARPRALVQAMVPPGLEMIVGMVRDEVFGPVVVCGLDGVLTEMVADRVLLCPPSGPEVMRASLAALRGPGRQ